MKRWCVFLLITVLMLSGCSDRSYGMDEIISIRNDLQRGDGCNFDITVTTDYGSTYSTFKLSCCTDNSNNMNLTVKEPETISGIACKIAAGKGQMTFDEESIAFEMLADGQIAPISIPWLLVETLRAGYINSCSKDESGVLVFIDDSFGNIDFNMEIWLNTQNVPSRAELIWQGKRIASMEISNFSFL